MEAVFRRLLQLKQLIPRKMFAWYLCFGCVKKVCATPKASKNFAKSSKKLSVGADFDEKQKIDAQI